MKSLGVVAGLVLLGNTYAQVMPPHCVVAGKTIEEWTRLSYQYCVPLPFNEAPYNAPEGNPVLYVSGATVRDETHIVRQYSVPENNYLLIPLLMGYYIHSGPDVDPNEMRNELSTWYEPPPILYFSVNGTPAENLLDQRVSSPAFTVDLTDPDNLFTQTFRANYLGIWTVVVEGYWIMLEPLPVGVNVVDFGGAYNMPGAYWFTRTDTITVEPVSPQQWVADLIPAAEQVLRLGNIAEGCVQPLREAQIAFAKGDWQGGVARIIVFQEKLQQPAKHPDAKAVKALLKHSQRIVERANKTEGKERTFSERVKATGDGAQTGLKK